MSDELKGFSFKPLDDELLQPINAHSFTTPIVTELSLGNGSLKFSDGKFLFEGDAEESAKVFLEFLNQNHMGKVAQLEQEVKELKALQERYVWITRDELEQYSDVNQALLGKTLAQHDKEVSIKAIEDLVDYLERCGFRSVQRSTVNKYIEQLQEQW